MTASTDEQVPISNVEQDGAVSQSKSKRKGEGRWTRIERACERCKKMKTRVFVPLHMANEVSAMRRGLVIIVEEAVINVHLKSKTALNEKIWKKSK
jgi:RNA polymerase subunit RPABC4/transcription elongation factor Spt4